MQATELAEMKEKIKTNNSFIILDLDLTPEILNPKTIRKKCKELSLKYHPDKNKNNEDANEIQTAINNHCTKLTDILKIKNEKEKRKKLYAEYHNSVKFKSAKKIGIGAALLGAALLGASYIGYKWATKKPQQKTQKTTTEKSVSKNSRRSQRSQDARRSQRYQRYQRSQDSERSESSEDSESPQDSFK
jgi:curved DNA-binding protein CbpA